MSQAITEARKRGRINAGLEFIDNVVMAYEGDDCIPWPFATYRGYGRLTINGKTRSASRVICERVNGPAPSPKHEAAHNCGNGKNGCANKRHLRRATSKENNADKLIHGTLANGSRQGASKLTEDSVIEIRLAGNTVSVNYFAAKYGVDVDTIYRAKTGRQWHHIKNPPPVTYAPEERRRGMAKGIQQ